MAANCMNAVGLYGSHEVLGLENKESGGGVGSLEMLAWKNELKGRQIVLKEQSGSDGWNPEPHSSSTIHAQTTSICVPRALRWWEKSITTNMTDINSAEELVHALLGAGDKLVVVDFYSPGCGGCKALHPKICQIAEANQSAVFFKVNYDENKPMCRSLHIHVLPFFQFYRGAQGRVCGFSCTNATIKKFKDALAKHGTDRCSLGPPKGLEESELISLALNKDIDFTYPLRSSTPEDLALGSSNTSSIANSLEGNINGEERTAALSIASFH